MSQKIKKRMLTKHNKGTTNEKMEIDIILEMLPIAINWRSNSRVFIKVKTWTNVFFPFIVAIYY
tara:strand:- start:1680 stop:1871 length:192 start_codon:yes stop_codon:yes gene_type:complete